MMVYYAWWVYLIIAIPGIFLFVMNWAIFFHNKLGKRYVSNVPPLGGLWIAVVCLISPCKWLALIGLADPGLWLFIAAIISEHIPGKK